jgi:hypothetical protein
MRDPMTWLSSERPLRLVAFAASEIILGGHHIAQFMEQLTSPRPSLASSPRSVGVSRRHLLN